MQRAAAVKEEQKKKRESFNANGIHRESWLL